MLSFMWSVSSVVNMIASIFSYLNGNTVLAGYHLVVALLSLILTKVNE